MYVSIHSDFQIDKNILIPFSNKQQKLTGHFHFATGFFHIKLQKDSPSKQWMC